MSVLQFNTNIFPKYYPHLFYHDFDRNGVIPGGITFCYTFSKNYDKIIYSIAKCHVKDSFSKEEGRKISLYHSRQGKVFSISFEDCVFFLEHNNFFLKHEVFYSLSFYDIMKSVIAQIICLDCLRILRKNHYYYEYYKKKLNNNSLPVCLLCSGFKTIILNKEYKHCKKCDFSFCLKNLD